MLCNTAAFPTSLLWSFVILWSQLPSCYTRRLQIHSWFVAFTSVLYSGMLPSQIVIEFTLQCLPGFKLMFPFKENFLSFTHLLYAIILNFGASCKLSFYFLYSIYIPNSNQCVCACVHMCVYTYIWMCLTIHGSKESRGQCQLSSPITPTYLLETEEPRVLNGCRFYHLR